jgi:hypothetical protein
MPTSHRYRLVSDHMRVSIALAMQTLRGRLSKLPDAVPEMPDVVSEIPDPVQKFPVPNPCSGPAG